MVNVSIDTEKLILRVEGWDKLWAYKSSLEIPLEHVVAVRADPMIRLTRPDLSRAPGSFAPGKSTPGSYFESGLSLGFAAVGTFWEDGRRVFWDVHRAEGAVVIAVQHERYDELVVEVADPQAAVQMIRSALET